MADNITNQYYKKLSILLNKLIKKYKIFIITGGGNTSRKYIKFGRELGLNEKFLDDIGITFTRLNAKLLTNILNNSNKIIPKTIKNAIKMNNKIVVMGGTKTGHSTDYVGAELSSKINANKFIIATNVDGVYDKDPNRYHDAKHIKEINTIDLINKYGISWEKAGSNIIIDGPALKIIHENKIKTYVINGKKLDELEKAILDFNFNGTKIKN